MNKALRFTNHALDRMETRNISETRVAQTMFCGQIREAGNGLFKARSWEYTGNDLICHEVIFSKEENLIVTVWNVSKPFKIRQEKMSKHQEHKIFKQRKQAFLKQEFDSWCREEYNACSLRFTA